MPADHIPYLEARASQPAALESAVGRVREQVIAERDRGRLRGEGPLFAAVGASLAAASAPVWVLRSRTIHAARLAAGDHPLPFPPTEHPVVGISQSGRSPETLAVLESIDRPLRVAVTNRRPSPIDTAADVGIWLGDLPDSFASTVGYSATVVGLGMMADAWDGGTLDPDWDRLPELAAETDAMVLARAAELAAVIGGAVTVDVVGCGPALGSAEVGALLFREVARFPATAMSTRQYLHGPMESAGASAHILFGDTREIELARTLARADHPVILVTARSIAEEPRLHVVNLPALRPSPRAVLEAIVMQVLTGAVAERNGVDVDAFVFFNADTKVELDPASAAAP